MSIIFSVTKKWQGIGIGRGSIFFHIALGFVTIVVCKPTVDVIIERLVDGK